MGQTSFCALCCHPPADDPWVHLTTSPLAHLAPQSNVWIQRTSSTVNCTSSFGWHWAEIKECGVSRSLVTAPPHFSVLLIVDCCLGNLSPFRGSQAGGRSVLEASPWREPWQQLRGGEPWGAGAAGKGAAEDPEGPWEPRTLSPSVTGCLRGRTDESPRTFGSEQK